MVNGYPQGAPLQMIRKDGYFRSQKRLLGTRLMIKTKQDLFMQMSAAATIITPNNRLSNQLLQEFYHQKGSVIEDKPHCLPYQTFLRDLYNKTRHLYPHITHPVVLSNIQQRQLWRAILTNQQDYPCNEGLLHEIQDAWTRCKHWEIDSENPAFSHTPQTRQFHQWQKQMLQALTRLNAITEEQLIHQIMLYEDTFSATTVIWVCFDDYTPQQRALQQSFERHGYQQYHYDLEIKSITTHCYVANDHQDECLQMINWLKCRIAAGDTRIGVVVPDLQAQYRPLQRLLQRHIPQDQFSISLGKPLTDYPLVTHALTWLGLDKRVISNHHARLLLHTPYLFGAKSELSARTQTIQDCKLLQEAEIPFDLWLQELTETSPNLAKLLGNLSDYPQQATPQVWVHHFKTRLTMLGFPGEYPLNSSTYQCFQRFVGLFDELLQLSIVSPLMSMQTALDALHDVAKSTIFQTRKSTTPIQILGLLEASGCTFDSVWVSGLTDQCLPKKVNLSAFIPLDLQRDLEMPHAVVARELQFAQQLLQRLQHGSKQSVFSYPRLTGDTPNLPSPLIIHLPVFTATRLQTPSTTSALICQQEDYLLPLGASETVSGGTSLLANQAKCPFRAFAAHRLHAKSESSLSTGPDASERGQIIHRIMELLWQKIESQQHLKALTEDELNTLIDEVIHTALTPYIKRLSFSPLVQNVEFARLRRLVLASLDWDKQRPAFTVESLEQTFTINLAGIDFKVRIDRLDRLASNKKWVIDYKTSIPMVKPWNEDRPESPQLLLYALLDDTINALLFIQLKAGNLTCSGFTEEPLAIKGISGLKKNEQWSEYRDQWHQQLTELATEFRTGVCLPQPTRASTCDFCDFSNLCRV